MTSVLNIFLLGVPLAPGSEILVGEMEYGAIVNVCRMRAEERISNCVSSRCRTVRPTSR